MASIFTKDPSIAENSKTCPKCGTKHSNFSEFCRLGCSRSRVWSEESNKKRSKSKSDFFKSPEGSAAAKKLSKKMTAFNKSGKSNTALLFDEVPTEDFAVSIPDFKPDIEDFNEFLEGFERAEKW